MSSDILVFEAYRKPRRSAWLVSAYGGEWEDKYERPLAVYATKGEAIRAAEAYEAEGHDDLYCDGCAEGAYVYEIEGENYDGPIDPTCVAAGCVHYEKANGVDNEPNPKEN